MKTPRNIAISVVIFLALLVVWQAVVVWFKVPDFIVPAPTKVFAALYEGFARGIYLKHLGITLYEALAGFAIGVVVGLAIGAGIALNRHLEFFVYPYVVMFQSVPKVALAPLMVIWFGLGMTSKIVSAAMVAFFPMMINTISGLRSADEDRVNLMKSLTASDFQVLTMLRLPTAMPHIMAGVEIALTFALLGTIVAEFLGASVGLGMLLTSMNFSMDVAGEFSILLILSVVGLAFSAMIDAIRKSILFWDASARRAVNAPEPAADEETHASGDAIPAKLMS
jgi:NitT/TauT family transport system permease protein